MPKRPDSSVSSRTPRRSAAARRPTRRGAEFVQGDLTPFQPDAARPIRVRARRMAADARVLPHAHAWAQLSFSATGVCRVDAGDSTFIVPPSRAVWIPPQVEHAVTVIEDADLRTLYLHQPPGRCGPGDTDETPWRRCRVVEVSPLLRELVLQLATDPSRPPAAESDRERERHLTALILDELRRAPAVPLGLALPRDKRLRSLCDAVLDDPARHDSLGEWARDAGASERTVARLFRQELGTSFAQWRQQVLLAKALSLAARGLPMGLIAAELGYASASAFSAMVRRTVGAPPSRFFATERGRRPGKAG